MSVQTPHGLILAGMKHSGKSTLARMVAWEYKARYFDLDDLTEAAYRSDRLLSCREIYTQHGKETFMELEAEAAAVLAGHMRSGATVASLGGGTIDNLPAMEALSGTGVLVYLKVDADVLFKRISRGGIPPFLSAENPRRDFYELYKRRTALLEEWAEVVVILPDDKIKNSFKRVLNSIEENGYAW